MDDRKKIIEWAKKNGYKRVIVISPMPTGERFGYNIIIRNVALDKDIKLGMEQDLPKAKAKAEEYRQFFDAVVRIEGTERK